MIDIKEDNFRCNYVKFDWENKIEIEYTRSNTDYIRWILYFIIKIIIVFIFLSLFFSYCLKDNINLLN